MFELFNKYFNDDAIHIDFHLDELWYEWDNSWWALIDYFTYFVEYKKKKRWDNFDAYISFPLEDIWFNTYRDWIDFRMLLQTKEPPSIWLTRKNQIFNNLWWWEMYSREIFTFSVKKNYHVIYFCFRSTFAIENNWNEYAQVLRIYYLE